MGDSAKNNTNNPTDKTAPAFGMLQQWQKTAHINFLCSKLQFI